MVKNLTLENVGPIKRVDLQFGDLTVLVGPQATGKSISLQLLKLVEDIEYIKSLFKEYGYYPGDDADSFLSLFLGESMSQVWRKDSRAFADNQLWDLKANLVKNSKQANPLTFIYIPAHRAMIYEGGWLKPFADLSHYPYVVREFSRFSSECIQKSIESDSDPVFFPSSGKFKDSIKAAISESILHEGQLGIFTKGPQKRIMFHPKGATNPISMSAGSTGQREFVPYLIALHQLIPSGTITKDANIATIVIEEIEMGLHPLGIIKAMMTVIDLLSRGYRVILTTHSPSVLDVIWLIQEIRETKKTDSAFQVFQQIWPLTSNTNDRNMIDRAMEKFYKVYYYQPTDNGVVSKDISTLDPDSDDIFISGWGGTSHFSGVIADLVGELYQGGKL